MAGAHKKSERVQRTEIYLLGLKLPYKHKTKLPLDMVSKHVPLSVQRPNSKQNAVICLHEKYVIIYDPKHSSLNSRNELLSTCSHRKKFLLCS